MSFLLVISKESRIRDKSATEISHVQLGYLSYSWDFSLRSKWQLFVCTGDFYSLPAWLRHRAKWFDIKNNNLVLNGYMSLLRSFNVFFCLTATNVSPLEGILNVEFWTLRNVELEGIFNFNPTSEPYGELFYSKRSAWEPQRTRINVSPSILYINKKSGAKWHSLQSL